MAVSISETFGYSINDTSDLAAAQRKSLVCPFTDRQCWKRFRAGGLTSGVCSLRLTTGDEVIICPDRLYADSYKVLKEIAVQAFGAEIALIPPADLASTQGQTNRVLAFGKRWGRELRVPKGAENAKDYSADWILAKIDRSGDLEEFTPVEIQSMDTTGSYQQQWCEINNLTLPKGCKPTSPGLNWENVNKRIISQLLVKGNVFGRENLCRKGLFFVCPTPVYQRLMSRLGSKLSPWPLRSGTLTFRWYDLEKSTVSGKIRKLVFGGQFTTTVENFKEAYNSTLNLPPIDVMQATITTALQGTLKPPKSRNLGSNIKKPPK